MQKITILLRIGLLSVMLLVSCETVQPSKTATITDFPIKPELTHYTSPPVVKKVDEHYLVTKDLITNATILTDYYKRLEVWKEGNNIR